MGPSTLIRTLLPFFLVLFMSIPGNSDDSIKIKPMHKSPDPNSYQRVPDEVIVKFKSGVKGEDIGNILNVSEF